MNSTHLTTAPASASTPPRLPERRFRRLGSRVAHVETARIRGFVVSACGLEFPVWNTTNASYGRRIECCNCERILAAQTRDSESVRIEWCGDGISRAVNRSERTVAFITRKLDTWTATLVPGVLGGRTGIGFTPRAAAEALGFTVADGPLC